METIDQYALLMTILFADGVLKSYDEFAFHKIYQRANNFCIVDLSAFYFDVLKDRLYTSAPKSQKRRSAQTALWRIGETLVRVLAPIMSFTAEEVWHYLPKVAFREESVHLARFVDDNFTAGGTIRTPQATKISGEILSGIAGDKGWIQLRHVRESVLKALEEARTQGIIGTGLEAQVTLSVADPVYSILARYADQLRYLFIVSAVTLTQASGNGTGGVHVEVKKADGLKCERCWNYSIHVGEDKAYPTVCERCSAVLKELGGA